jgi:hypothetical protein
LEMVIPYLGRCGLKQYIHIYIYIVSHMCDPAALWLSSLPAQERAGRGLLRLLLANTHSSSQASNDDRISAALAVCDDCVARGGAPAWAVSSGALLRLQAGRAEEAVGALQGALRQQPGDAGLWELLGAAYHQHGRITSAMRVSDGGRDGWMD